MEDFTNEQALFFGMEAAVKENTELKKEINKLKIVIQVLEDFLDRRMGTEEELGYIPDSRPTIQVMERYPDEWGEVIYKRYGKIDEEDPKHQCNQ